MSRSWILLAGTCGYIRLTDKGCSDYLHPCSWPSQSGSSAIEQEAILTSATGLAQMMWEEKVTEIKEHDDLLT